MAVALAESDPGTVCKEWNATWEEAPGNRLIDRHKVFPTMLLRTQSNGRAEP